MYLPDFLGQHPVFSGPSGRFSFAPCVVAAGGDLQYTTHDADRKFGLVRPYESEDFLLLLLSPERTRPSRRDTYLPVYRALATAQGASSGAGVSPLSPQ